jgi:hypothetical protein
MTVLPAGAELFYADGQTDRQKAGRQAGRHEETNSLFRNFVNAPKNYLSHVSYILKRMCQIYF